MVNDYCQMNFKYLVSDNTYLIHGVDIGVVATFLLNRNLLYCQVLQTSILFLFAPDHIQVQLLFDLLLVAVSGIEELAGLFSRYIR